MHVNTEVKTNIYGILRIAKTEGQNVLSVTYMLNYLYPKARNQIGS